MSKEKLNKKLEILFKNLKIKKGDKIVVHSNIGGILQYYNKDKISISEAFFSFIKKYIGKNGIIIVPAYTYQFTKNKKFSVKNSPSEIGFFSNYLLKRSWANRTLDPVFSHLIFGKIKNYDLEYKNKDAFGINSIFNLFLKNNFKIICFCCSSDRMTFIHFIESILKVNYRFVKNFKGILEYKNVKEKILYKFNVGKKKYDYSLKEKKINKLLDQKNFIKKKFGKFECYSVNCKFLYSNLKRKIKKNEKYLIRK